MQQVSKLHFVYHLIKLVSNSRVVSSTIGLHIQHYLYSVVFCADMDLPEGLEPYIAQSIRIQLYNYRRRLKEREFDQTILPPHEENIFLIRVTKGHQSLVLFI